MPESVKFFEEMAGFSDFSEFTRLEHYTPLPSDWFVVITDIQGSTQAIQDGKYREVNSVSTASMIAVHNVFDSVELPYVFGGDGATLCIPPVRLDAVKRALAASRNLAMDSFGLKLRVGLVPVETIEEKHLQVLVAKFQPSDQFKQAVFQGSGLTYAEDLVKDKEPDNPYLLSDDIVADGNFEGFECRWNEIPSPNEEMIALIIKSLDNDVPSRTAVYQDVLTTINEIYGDEDDFHPLRPANLSLTLSLKKLWIEACIRTPYTDTLARIKYLLKLVVLAVAGKYVMAKGVKGEGADWGMYKQNFITNTDYRKFDETLKMVICGSRSHRQELIAYLTAQYEAGKLVFGVHEAPSAIVTCRIIDYDKNHMHFLDGSNGGYAMAAKKMKQQLADLRP